MTLRTPAEGGYSQTVLDNVRVVRTSTVTDHLVTHTRERSELIVYYDCVNSTPTGTQFNAGQSLNYSGEIYEIVEATLFSGESPHHYRIRGRKTGGEFNG